VTAIKPRQNSVLPPRRQARACHRRRTRHRAGGGSGAGRSGAHVTLAARTRSDIEDAAAAIRARGEQAEALVLDVADVEAARTAIEAAAPFQILINNAGMNRPADFARSRSRISTRSSRSTCAPLFSWRRPWRAA